MRMKIGVVESIRGAGLERTIEWYLAHQDCRLPKVLTHDSRLSTPGSRLNNDSRLYCSPASIGSIIKRCIEMTKRRKDEALPGYFRV